jgi:hypothetical protein
MTWTTYIPYRALTRHAHKILPIKATTLENEKVIETLKWTSALVLNSFNSVSMTGLGIRGVELSHSATRESSYNSNCVSVLP